MDFFDKLGKKASEAYKGAADKTGKIAKETKLKLKMNELKGQISDRYEEIGKKVYENYVREEKQDINELVKEDCIKIDELSAEIESLVKETLELRDKKKCTKCYAELDKDARFCNNCGEKQEIEEVNQENQNSDEEEQENDEQEEQKNNEKKEQNDAEFKEELKEITEVESDQTDK